MSSRAPPAQSRNANLAIDSNDLFDAALLTVNEAGDRALHTKSFKKEYPEKVK